MDAITKYLLNYFQYKLSRLVAGRKNYDLWRSKSFSLQKVQLKNKKIAMELEEACEKNGGFLTYSEYLTIDQFGENGYHRKSSLHGKTDVHENWPKALVNLCVSSGYEEIIEVGCGDGELAVKCIQETQKMGRTLSWTGIEFNKRLHASIKNRFAKAKLTASLKGIHTTVKDSKLRKKTLAVFAYSLDSIPPDIFVNTTTTKSFPNALLGIVVKNGVLEEVILPPAALKKRKISLEHGIYTTQDGKQFDISTWQLVPMQRAYIPVLALTLFLDYVYTLPANSLFLILDEFRPAVFATNIQHLSLPKDLHLYNNNCEDIGKYYKQAGDNLFYFPLYFHSFLKFLNTIGFTSIQYDIEQKLAAQLSGKKWLPLKSDFCTYAFLASGTAKKTHKPIPLTLPVTKLF